MTNANAAIRTRYPQSNLAACMLPWTEDFELDVPVFERHVQSTIDVNYHCIYLMGTAGKGYALTDSRFKQVVDIFAALTVRNGTSDSKFNVDGLGDANIPDDADFDFYITDDSMLSTGLGDHDLNMIVNFSDFVKLSNDFGMSGTGWDQGNGNTDDITNFNDCFFGF